MFIFIQKGLSPLSKLSRRGKMMNFSKFNLASIRVRLLVIILVLMITSLSLLAGISYVFSKQALLTSLDETAAAIGDSQAKQICSEIQGLVIFLQDLAAHPHIRNSSEKAQLIAALAEAQQRNSRFDVVNYISSDGTALRNNGTTTNMKDREFVKMAFTTKKPAISEPVLSRANGKISIAIAVPILDNGQVAGMVSGAVALDNLQDIVKSVDFKGTGYGIIADSSGLVLAHGKQPELVGKLKLREKQINKEINLGSSELDDRLLRLFQQAAESGTSVKGVHSFADDNTLLSVFTPLDLPGSQRWLMIITAPEAEAFKVVDSLTTTLNVTAIICMIVGAIVIWFISASFAKPIIRMRDEALLLADGDLRQRELKISSKGEIGQLSDAFSQMGNKIRGLVGKVQSKAEIVAAASEQLTAGAQQSATASQTISASVTQIAEGSEEQSAAIRDMSGVVKEMTDNINRIAIKSKEIAEVGVTTAQSSAEGRYAINKAMEQMKIIGEGAQAVQISIGELADGSREIGEIVTLISSIAGQTNLLALNAAIEAARAGEAGRGFAVVAEEVRKLAEESNQAAQKIGALIQRNDLGMQQAIAVTETSSAGVKAGIDVVASAGTAFQNIAVSVEHLSIQVQTVTEAIESIAAGSQGLLRSVEQIEKVSNENATEAQSVSAATEEQSASMQEIAAASLGLAQTATELREAGASFKA